jgi:outer membrane protein insertion porin family
VRALAIVALIASVAEASPDKQPIVGFRVRGKSKLTEQTLAYLAHVATGDRISDADIPQLEKDLVSSELFEKVDVALVDADGGVIVEATLDDKLSWIVAPTFYVLSGNKAFGVGYAENNLLGRNKKLLLYGQIGNRDNLFFGAFLDPNVRGTKLTLRTDVYLYKRVIDEFLNPPDDPRSFEIGRTATTQYLGAGLLVGWTFAWWAIADLRIRGAYVSYSDAHAPDDSPLPLPDKDGWDVSGQFRLTLDHRYHRFGVTWGPYLQLFTDTAIPGLDDYGYSQALLRMYYSWVLFHEHQLELRTHLNIARHLPFHEELVNGGVIDLRGYELEQFHGDTRVIGRVEYSVPIAKWKFFAFRGIGFFDSGYIGYNFQRTDPARHYLATQTDGASWFRNDVGVGLRIYVKAVVLPLLGLDFAYGLEGHSPEVYFEVGLTDF